MSIQHIHWLDCSIFILFTSYIGRCSDLFSRNSPCPDVFGYEDAQPGDDRWYGEILLNTAEMSKDATLKITLHSPSHLLVTWAGNVVTFNNKVYIVNHDRSILNRGFVQKIRIMVKYDPIGEVPLLEFIHFNGRLVCSSRIPLSAGSESSSQYSRATKSDLEVTQYSSPVATTSARIGEIKCGQVARVAPLIWNGQQAQYGQWPWHVSIYRTDGVHLNYICGGSLVSKNKVITAAHCLFDNPNDETVTSKSLVVYLGKYNIRQHSEEQGVQTKEVYQVIINPEYDAKNFHNDIAIVTLSSSAKFTNYVRPICIWESEIDLNDILGKEGVIVGWGLNEYEQASDDLKVAKLPVVSIETCLRSHPKFFSIFTSDKSFCAGIRNGTGPCNGDGGNGLVFKRNSIWYLRGIVSLSVAKEGTNICDTKHYAVFTDVAKHGEFLKRNL